MPPARAKWSKNLLTERHYVLERVIAKLTLKGRKSL